MGSLRNLNFLRKSMGNLSNHRVERLGREKLLMDIQEPKRTGFSLLEVLAAMAIAALTFGVLLRSVSLQILTISRATGRYQSLAYASALLERKMAEGVTEDEAVSAELDSYSYSIDTHVVTADPRVQQVEVKVSANQGGGASLSAYRLRIRRRKQ